MRKSIWLPIIFLLTVPAIAQAGILDALGCVKSGNCGLPDLEALFVLLTNWLIGAIGALALMYFIWGAVQWITSSGRSDKVEHGKQIMVNSLIALLIALSSYLLVQFFINDVLLGGDQTNPYRVASECVGEAQGKSCNQPLLNYVCTGTFTDPAMSQYNNLCVTRCILQSIATGGDWACVTKGTFLATDKTVPLPDGCPDESQVCVDTDTIEQLERAAAGCRNVETRNISPLQCNDASSNLSQLFTCLQNELSAKGTFYISSISDDVAVNNLSRCQGGNYDRPPCAHGPNSCHYGGHGNLSKSCAGDFVPGSGLTYSDLETAGRECGAYVVPEGDHIHMSVNGCTCDGHN